MSIIFQLFSAEDLKKFDVEELDRLRDEIVAALKEAHVLKEGEGKIHLNLREKVQPDEDTPPALNPQPEWVKEALLERFYEVSHQLKTPQNPQQLAFDFQQLIDERNNEDTQEQEEKILRWAISCELNHLEFYYALLVAKKGVDNFYTKYPQSKAKLLAEEQRQTIAKLLTQEQQRAAITLEKVRTKDSDSLYSPFNPRHPLYRQYYDASR
jgi:hypothetical protein